VAPVLPLRMLLQPLVDRSGAGLEQSLAIAREESAPLTTAQPGSS
jgi:hypothetical protein